MSHRRTSDLIIILDYCVTVIKNVTQGAKVKKICVCDKVILVRFLVWALSRNCSPSTGWFKEECNTSTTTSQRSRARIPSMRKPASKERTSDSVQLRETEVCFLHIQILGTNVRLPNIHTSLPMLVSNIHGPQQSLSLGTVPIDSALLKNPHGNIVCDHPYYECRTSRELSVTGSCPFSD